MYPRNGATPNQVAIGTVVQISDGAVQTSGCTVRVFPFGGAEGDGGGTTAYSTDGVVLYTPTQAETNYTSVILIAKKTGCIPAAVTVVTTASATAGIVVAADTQKVDLNTVKTQTVTCAAPVTVLASVGTASASTAQTADCANIPTITAWSNKTLAVNPLSLKINDVAVLPAVAAGGKGGLPILDVTTGLLLSGFGGALVTTKLNGIQGDIAFGDVSCNTFAPGSAFQIDAATGWGGSALPTAFAIPGPGKDRVTLEFLNGSTPVADADVWISTDSDGKNVVAGTLQTNSNGQVTFLLDAGLTYYKWMQKDGFDPILGVPFVAEAD